VHQVGFFYTIISRSKSTKHIISTCLQLGGSSVVLAGIYSLYNVFLFYYVGHNYGNPSTANGLN